MKYKIECRREDVFGILITSKALLERAKEFAGTWASTLQNTCLSFRIHGSSATSRATTAGRSITFLALMPVKLSADS